MPCTILFIRHAVSQAFPALSILSVTFQPDYTGQITRYFIYCAFNFHVCKHMTYGAALSPFRPNKCHRTVTITLHRTTSEARHRGQPLLHCRHQASWLDKPLTLVKGGLLFLPPYIRSDFCATSFRAQLIAASVSTMGPLHHCLLSLSLIWPFLSSTVHLSKS